MEINLSIDTIHVVYNSLRGTKRELNRQLVETDFPKEIIEHQIEEVNSALVVFEELLDQFYDYDRYIPSCTNGDYGPSNPWDAPGMSISDFI